MEALDRAIGQAGAAGFVMYASSQDADMRYLTRFRVGDPVIFFKKPGLPGTIVVPQMEYDRAVAECSCAVMSRGDAGYFDILEEEPDPRAALARMIARQVGGDMLVPPTFPLSLARKLEEHGAVRIDTGTVAGLRAVKTSAELAAIRETQRVNEAALDLALTMIRKARVRNGMLVMEGTPLTSEILRRKLHVFFIERGYTAADTIISCGAETAMPHRTGSGPLMANEPIVIDIFPRHEESGYHADMTRTVVKGEADPAVSDLYEAVAEGQALGKHLIRAGIAGKDVHQAVVDYFDDRGYATDKEGFIHSLGHGVGLEIHEKPSLGPAGEALAAGHVVTVEPGLYYAGTGGVRLEDMGVVTQQGFDCFTRYPQELEI
ncbi:MAG: Xaa-Pro peptidase family protein [Methanomicrobiaceae archaeon]|nr:Xaa-Pro peptidase family protein [Methanomicrobiaceae archaeon]